MDRALKDLLERAEDWPREAKDELIDAAKTIERRLSKIDTDRRQTLRDGDQSSDPAPPKTLIEALRRAPKVKQSIAPKRFKVRVRPPVKF